MISTYNCPKKQRCTWLYSDYHSRTEFNGTLYVISIMNIHAKIMTYMMWTELTSDLQFNIIKKYTTAAN